MKKNNQKALLKHILNNDIETPPIATSEIVPYYRINNNHSEKIYIAESDLLETLINYDEKVKEIKMIITSLKRSLSLYQNTIEKKLSIFNRIKVLYNIVNENACTELLKRELGVDQYELLYSIIKEVSILLKSKRYQF